jgi:hypothetical protein
MSIVFFNKKFLWGSRGQFLQKAPPGRRRQKLCPMESLLFLSPFFIILNLFAILLLQHN